MTLNVERLRERYRKYKLYSRLTNASVGALVVTLISIWVAQYFVNVSYNLYAILGSVLPLVSGGVFLVKRDAIVLSSDERIAAMLMEAIPNLEAFLEKGREKDRDAAVKDLNAVSVEMNNWTFGTIELIEREIGKPTKRFRERFQKRLLPAVRTGDGETVRKMLALLKIVYTNFMLGNYTVENFQRWSNALEDIQETQVGMGVMRSLWLTPERRMIMITLGSLFSGVIVFTLELWVGASSRDALSIAAPVAAAIFAGLAFLVAYAKPSAQR